MKIWIKYLIAIIIGGLVGLIAPSANGNFINTLADVSLNIGRYILLPMMFFSTVIASFELYNDKKLHKIWLKTVVLSIFSLVLFTIIGLLGAFVLLSKRIPLSADNISDTGLMPSFLSFFSDLVPANAIVTLTRFDFMLPSSLFALMIGLGFAFDKNLTKPVVSLFDTTSKILWQINSFFVEVLPIPLIIASVARVTSIFSIQNLNVFGSLFLVLSIETLFVIFGLIPFILWLSNNKANPYKTLFALTASALVAFISGHTYVQAGVSAKHLKESLGIQRRISAVSMPIVLAFARAGTAMVTATAFITLRNSYSISGMGFLSVLWLVVSVPIVSLLLGASPKSGPIVALTALSSMYGKGFESGYVLLVPVAMPLAMVAALIDSIVNAVIVTIIANDAGCAHYKELRHYI